MILQLIDVMIGLSLVYLIFSTVASALADLFEATRGMRGRLLERGIRTLLARVVTGDGKLAPVQDPAALLRALYDSPSIYSLFRDDYEPGGRRLPSYIPAERFASAILTLAENGELKQDFTRIRDTLLAFSGVDVAALPPAQWLDAAHAQIVAYYNETMDRVTGWYTRLVRWRLFIIGLLLALVFNVDSIRLIRQLSEDDTLRQNLVSQALIDHGDDGALMASSVVDTVDDDAVQRAQDQINRQLALVESLGLPIGWTRAEWQRVSNTAPPANAEPGTPPPRWSVGRLLASAAAWSKLAGLLLTACALSFGAPFWFDLVNQLVKLRTSIKPDERARKDAATASSGGDGAIDAALTPAVVRIEVAPTQAPVPPASGGVPRGTAQPSGEPS